MNDLLQSHSIEKISLADIESGIREGRRMRSEELRRLSGCVSAFVRKEFLELGRFAAKAGKAALHGLEVMTLRMQQSRVHHD